MGGLVKAAVGIFTGGGSSSGSAPAQAPAPVAPPIAPPAYSNPHAASGDAAGNISNSARAAGAFSDTIITGPEGLKEKESTSSPTLKSTLGS